MPVQISIDDTYLQNNVYKYLDTTHKYNDYNEIYNLNQYLLDVNSIEEGKLSEFNEHVSSKLMKLKQEYMLTDYSIQETNMYVNILVFTIIVICLMLALLSIWKKENMNSLMIVYAVIGVLYLLVVLLILKANANRRKYAWSQWYWNPMKKDRLA